MGLGQWGQWQGIWARRQSKCTWWKPISRQDDLCKEWLPWSSHPPSHSPSSLHPSSDCSEAYKSPGTRSGTQKHMVAPTHLWGAPGPRGQQAPWCLSEWNFRKACKGPQRSWPLITLQRRVPGIYVYLKNHFLILWGSICGFLLKFLLPLWLIWLMTMMTEIEASLPEYLLHTRCSFESCSTIWFDSHTNSHYPRCANEETVAQKEVKPSVKVTQLDMAVWRYKPMCP